MIFGMKKKQIADITAILLVAGGINWGLALFDFNLVTYLAEMTFAMLEPIVYGAVGIAAVVRLFVFGK